MLHVTFPSSWCPERRWIAAVVLKEFLGLEYELGFGNADIVRISAADKTLSLSDAFFAGEMRMADISAHWTIDPCELDATLCQATIPVLFGAPGFTLNTSGDAFLELDVFGSAFFMLTRYEEFTRSERDPHDRFPAHASLAARSDFLDRPIVDEYVEILWAAMRRVWPGIKRKRRDGRKLISCDVDTPFDPACYSLARLGKRLVGRTWRERSLGGLPSSVGNYWAVRRGDDSRDPYWRALFFIMDANERAGNQVTFNVIPERTDHAMDDAPSLDDRRMRTLLRAVAARGHLVGIHPGYNTYRHPDAFARSVATLRRTLEEEHISQDELGGRQHYLRWNVRTTAQLWAANALSYDSTLSYPTVAGFRTGTCHEYTMYDLVERCPLSLTQRPLIVMENAVIDEPNMGLGHGEQAMKAMQNYKRICSRFDGDFTLLWHNSSFTEPADEAMYSDLIQ